jgi:hypothetical protein
MVPVIPDIPAHVERREPIPGRDRVSRGDSEPVTSTGGTGDRFPIGRMLPGHQVLGRMVSPARGSTVVTSAGVRRGVTTARHEGVVPD